MEDILLPEPRLLWNEVLLTAGDRAGGLRWHVSYLSPRNKDQGRCLLPLPPTTGTGKCLMTEKGWNCFSTLANFLPQMLPSCGCLRLCACDFEEHVFGKKSAAWPVGLSVLLQAIHGLYVGLLQRLT